ncbi:MAG: helix-hairpin-helix domain-containing protein [Pseudomonadota bacterium]|nr:helix-hairpin-helix domain-containing protein [Pseudomonadota bacterium]
MTRFPFFAALVLLFSLMTGMAHANEPVNINTADVAALAALDGIGEAKAQAIVEYRDTNGPFASADALTNVKGIGNATLQKNADRITVE